MFPQVDEYHHDCECFNNHIFQLKGRRPRTTVISQATKTQISITVLPHIGKLDCIYQVTDNHTVTYQTLHWFAPFTQCFARNFLWKSQIFVSTAKVIAHVTTRVVVMVNLTYLVSGSMELFDGPGKASDKVLKFASETQMSSFQSFIVVYSTNLLNNANLNAWKNYQLHYKQNNIQPIKVVVEDGKKLALPPCTPDLHQVKRESDGIQEYQVTTGFVPKNHHCVYEILSSSSHFVNVSFNRIFFHGPDTQDTFTVGGNQRIHGCRRHCTHGGIAFETRKPDEFENFHKLEDNIKFICENYTSDENVNFTDKSVMNIVSGSKKGMFLVLFSYKGYSYMSVDVEISETPCKGIPYHTSKC